MAVYKNSLVQIRQWVASSLGDLIIGAVKTDASNSTTVAMLGSTTPPKFYNKGDGYFNLNWFEAYTYEGTNIGTSQLVSDWANSTHTLTFTPAATSAFDNTSKVELHYLFSANEYLNAINMVIEGLARRYLFQIDDETSTTLTESTTNDGNTIFTYEYDIPTNFLYLHQITKEDYTGGKKLTGTVGAAFTLGETVTADVSLATGIISYEDDDDAYILVREVDGTFAVGDTVTGASGSCGALTAVVDETVGKGTFTTPLDHRDWRIIQTGTSPHTMQLDKHQVTFYGDLRLRWEGQGSQAKVSADTDYIYVKPDWLIAAAITKLPYSKIESGNLQSIVAVAQAIAARPPISMVHPAGKAVIE